MTCPLSMGLIRNQIQILFGSANVGDQQLATRNYPHSRTLGRGCCIAWFGLVEECLEG